MTLYFGYGSNLDAQDWNAFCQRWGFVGAELTPVTTALLLDHELVFDRYAASRRGGALNLRARPGQAAEGVVFRANTAALYALDRKEGAPAHYQRVQRHAVLPDGRVTEVMTYLAPSQGHHAPHADYVHVVRRGQAARKGEEFDEAQDAEIVAMVEAMQEEGSLALRATGAITDDGIIDPRDTRTVLGMCLSVIDNQPIEGTRGYGVFRM